MRTAPVTGSMPIQRGCCGGRRRPSSSVRGTCTVRNSRWLPVQALPAPAVQSHRLGSSEVNASGLFVAAKIV